MATSKRDDHSESNQSTSDNEHDASMSGHASQQREIPESIRRLRGYMGRADPTPSTSHVQGQNVQPQSLNRQQPLTGPYAKQPPVYVGSLSRKDLARKNRIQTAMIGMGLGTMIIGIYSYTVWKRMQLGIDDTELIRLEEEALMMVESGEIDLEAIQQKADEAKVHKY